MRACVGDPRQRGSSGRRTRGRARGRERGANSTDGPISIPRGTPLHACTRTYSCTRRAGALGTRAEPRASVRARMVRAPLARYRYMLVQRRTAPYAPPRGSAPCTHATSGDSGRRRARGATQRGMTPRRVRGTAAARGATPRRYARGAIGVEIAHTACFYRIARASEHSRPRATAQRMRACVGDPRQRRVRGRRD